VFTLPPPAWLLAEAPVAPRRLCISARENQKGHSFHSATTGMGFPTRIPTLLMIYFAFPTCFDRFGRGQIGENPYNYTCKVIEEGYIACLCHENHFNQCRKCGKQILQKNSRLSRKYSQRRKKQ